MAKQEVTAVQVQMAAAAGVKLLQVDDLPVPLVVAKTGALGVLESMLQALASGEVVLAQPTVAVTPPPGDPAPIPNVDPPEGVTPIEEAKGKGKGNKGART